MCIRRRELIKSLIGEGGASGRGAEAAASEHVKNISRGNMEPIGTLIHCKLCTPREIYRSPFHCIEFFIRRSTFLKTGGNFFGNASSSYGETWGTCFRRMESGRNCCGRNCGRRRRGRSAELRSRYYRRHSRTMKLQYYYCRTANLFYRRVELRRN